MSAFERDGYAVVENVVSESALAGIRADYAARLDELCAQWLRAGILRDGFTGVPFDERIRLVVNAIKDRVPDWVQHFNIILPSNGIRADSPIHLSQGVFRFLANPDILDLVEPHLGGEISLHPIALVRLKLPERDVPAEQRSGITARAVWHQDRGVGLAEFNRAHFITVWTAVTEATEENGCVRLIPGSHRAGLIEHCPGGVTSFDAGVVQIPDRLLPGKDIAVPVKPGSVLLLHPEVVHGSGVNRSDGLRWSFDLRFLRTGDPTGRPEWPSLPLRSRHRPDSVARFPDWRDGWLAARARLATLDGAALPHRWDSKVAAHM